MKPTHKFIKQYCEAKLQETMLEDQLNRVLQQFNPDNYLVGMTPPKSYELLEAVMKHIAGAELMDWVYWWMYECEHGTAHMTFSVDGVEYDPTKLTFKEFLEIVDDRP